MESGCAQKDRGHTRSSRNLVCFLPLAARDTGGCAGNAHTCALEHIHHRAVCHTNIHEYAKPDIDAYGHPHANTYRNAHSHTCVAHGHANLYGITPRCPWHFALAAVNG